MSDVLPFDASPPADANRTEVAGTLVGITYRNERNGYTVARLEVEGAKDPIVAVGAMPGVEVGDSLRLRGRWMQHPQYGRQLEVASCELRLPTGRKGLIQFLGGGRIKGVGPKTAEKIVDNLGTDVLARIERNPVLLESVPGLSRKKAAAIAGVLAEQREAATALVFLQEHGLGPALALRVFREYGAETVARVRKNPYCLSMEVFGIGFRRADAIAASLGIEKDSSFRLAAGLEHLLGQAALEGHVGLPVEDLVRRGAPFLEVEEQPLERVLLECVEQGRLAEDGLLYRPELLAAEKAVAQHLRRLLAPGGPAPSFDPERALAWAEQSAKIELSDDQRAAVRLALGSRVCVVTGGPGVGKTTLVRCLVDVLRAARKNVALAAPTGRASRRLEQAAGAAASTLHRLLGIVPAGVGLRREGSPPLEADVLIVDEASMVDVALAAAVLSALPDGTSLVLVGDVDQLPSVGPGEFLRSAIDSGVVPVARLSTIWRQAEHSGIVRVAHEINAGVVPRFDEGPDGQAFWVERADAPAALAALRALVTERIPQRFGLHPLRDVQVLTPMHKGPVGTVALNEMLRQTLNPPSPRKAELPRAGRLFRVGDKVMQVKNNYDLDVFNGDVGLLLSLDEDAGVARVDFDGRQVEYGLELLDQLEPAFAITCHKSQGSEFPAVLLPLFSSQFLMLRRNLVYTAFTRAKQVLVGVGEHQALQRAIFNVDTGTRHGRLVERLRGE